MTIVNKVGQHWPMHELNRFWPIEIQMHLLKFEIQTEDLRLANLKFIVTKLQKQDKSSSKVVSSGTIQSKVILAFR